MATLLDLVRYSDQLLAHDRVADYDHALNGLQIENSGRVDKIAAAVDASSSSIAAAAEKGASLLIVHHGLFWPGLQPITGALRRQIQRAFDADLALYSSHLPLDLHPELGNNAQLLAALELGRGEPFLLLKGQPAGLRAHAGVPVKDLAQRLERSLGAPVKMFAHGPAETSQIGIVTGGAGSEIAAVAQAGIDTFITGEAPHWAAIMAQELGVNLLLGGHYATETFGVKALAQHLAERFELPWEFIDLPTGL